MKMSHGPRRRRSARTDAARRTELLAAYERSGLSAAAFARQHGLNYTTFCGWRSRQARTALASPGFVQIELPSPAARSELVLELGAGARLRLHCADQLDLAVQLLGKLNTLGPC
jgi:transposase-like protein